MDGRQNRGQAHLVPDSSSSLHTSCPSRQDGLGPSRLTSRVLCSLCLSDWLLLQTPRLVFQAGEPIKLRCHSWRNKPLHKITFYHNGKSKMFSYQNSSFSIPQANASHSGEYHCLGIIGHTQRTSQPVNITIEGGVTVHVEGGEEKDGQSGPRSLDPHGHLQRATAAELAIERRDWLGGRSGGQSSELSASRFRACGVLLRCRPLPSLVQAP